MLPQVFLERINMEELKTKYPELDKLLAKLWGVNADVQYELQELKDLYQDLGNDDLDEAFEAIENTIDMVEELDTHRDKIKEVLKLEEKK
jgi:hypothetical protein